MKERRRMNPKEHIMKSFDWEIPIAWYGLTGYYQMGDGRVAKIIAAPSGIAGEYEQFLVKIVDVHGGTIDSCAFKFVDYLELSEKRHSHEKLAISSYIDYRWIVHPKTTTPICEAIEQWIEMFR